MFHLQASINALAFRPAAASSLNLMFIIIGTRFLPWRMNRYPGLPFHSTVLAFKKGKKELFSVTPSRAAWSHPCATVKLPLFFNDNVSYKSAWCFVWADLVMFSVVLDAYICLFLFFSFFQPFLEWVLLTPCCSILKKFACIKQLSNNCIKQLIKQFNN